MLNKPWKTIENVDIYGNNHLIPTITWYDLTEKEQKDHDYLDTEDKQENFIGFRYKGIAYDLFGEFTHAPNALNPGKADLFHGIANDTYFSGILVWIEDGGEHVKAYTYFAH